MLISTDGGKTFPTYQMVNDFGCANGVQDQPSAAMDPTTDPPTLWVSFRHQGSTLATSGGCVRGGQFFGDHIVWNRGTGQQQLANNPATSIANMVGEDLISSQGGIHVQAGEGVVTVVYSTTANFGTLSSPCCPKTGPKGVGWQSVSSFDGGDH